MYENELYHYGVKGMKWGVRRYHNEDGSLTAVGKAKTEYKEAKKTYKRLDKYAKKIRRSARTTEERVEAKNVNTEANKAYVNLANARAKYKSSTARDGEKAEFKSYAKSMYNTGRYDSYADRKSGGRSTALYDDLLINKGELYVKAVDRKVNDRLNAQLALAATAAAIQVGKYYVDYRIEHM